MIIELHQRYTDKSSDILGYTIVGAGTTDNEFAHWLLMYKSAATIDMWHSMRVAPGAPGQRVYSR